MEKDEGTAALADQHPERCGYATQDYSISDWQILVCASIEVLH